MPVGIQVSGLASVVVEGTLLGYTRNGVEIVHDAFYLDVPGDENGGDDGPPIDIQLLGEIDRIRCELTKWDNTVANVIRSRVKTGGGIAGIVPNTGVLMFGDALYFPLAIIPAYRLPFNYAYAFPRSAVEENRGTKFATLVVEFECHKNPGTADRVIYTQT